MNAVAVAPKLAASGEALLRAFEAGSLDPDTFHHAQHVELAWLHVTRMPLLEALARYSSGLRRFAESLGKGDRYHETITWAYLVVVAERAHSAPEDDTWDAFAARNPDLFAWGERGSLLSSYYSPERLRAPVARALFVLPDRAP